MMRFPSRQQRGAGHKGVAPGQFASESPCVCCRAAAYTEGGGSANYGISQGGCFAEPVDAKWTGTTCVSNLDTTAAYKDGVPTDDIRQNCCTVDKCNDRPNPAARTRVSAVTAGTTVLAAWVSVRSLCTPL